MNRRDFIARVGAATALSVWPLAGRTQQPGMRRIGFLGASTASKYAGLVDAFRAGLHDYGYVEGDNIVIDFRWADDDNARLSRLASELVSNGVELLVTHGTPGTLACKKTTATLPTADEVVE